MASSGTVVHKRKNGFGPFSRTQPFPEHTGIFKLHLEAKESLGTAGIRESVKLPRHIRQEEWIAAQVVTIYHEASQVVSLLEEICDAETCPLMCAGKHTAYSWATPEHPTPKSLPAIEYMNTLLDYTHKILADKEIVPQNGGAFPSCFEPSMKMLLKRLFRIYAHAYISHFQVIHDNEAEGHLNCCFKRFLYFVKEFNLVEQGDMMPLKDLIDKFMTADAKAGSRQASVEKKREDGGDRKPTPLPFQRSSTTNCT